jgi:hypothetical protein
MDGVAGAAAKSIRSDRPGSTDATAPGSTTTVWVAATMSAGPGRRWPGDRALRRKTGVEVRPPTANAADTTASGAGTEGTGPGG